jgi:hypothetical protein
MYAAIEAPGVLQHSFGDASNGMVSPLSDLLFSILFFSFLSQASAS